MAEEEQNLNFAKKLWEALKGIAQITMEERLKHLCKILHLAQLIRKASVIYADPKRGVADVLCAATTDPDKMTAIGTSSRLRGDCAKCVAGGSRQEFCKNATLLEKKLGFQVSAFDGETSRLCAEMAKAGEAVGEEGKPLKRPFDACAEHAVFEKLDRIDGQRPCFTYAVQKRGGSKKQSTFQVKIVKRCSNCELAGGRAQDDGHPFGMTARLGRVVTDHPDLVDLDVPVITPRVLQYLRTVIGAYYDYDTGIRSDNDSVAIVGMDNPSVLVWLNVDRQRWAEVPLLGPADTTAINQELSAAGLPENLLDEGGQHNEGWKHDEL